MTGVLETITLVAQGVPALIAAANQVKASWDLFNDGKITEGELRARWKDAGVTWQGESAALKASMDRAKGDGS